MKRVLVVGLVLGLLAGSLIGPAEAKKKKKKKPPPAAAAVPVDVNYYLRNDGDGCDAANLRLSTTDTTTGASCIATDGTVNEINMMRGEKPTTLVFNAADGLPLVLDASKEIKFLLGVSSYRGSASNSAVGLSAGPTTLVVTLLGTTNDGQKEIGKATLSYTVSPAQQVYKHEFAIKPDASLDKIELTALALDIYSRGLAPRHGFVRVEDPSSFFTIGTFQPAAQ